MSILFSVLSPVFRAALECSFFVSPAVRLASVHYLCDMDLPVVELVPEGHSPVPHPKPEAVLRALQFENIALGRKLPQVSFYCRLDPLQRPFGQGFELPHGFGGKDYLKHQGLSRPLRPSRLCRNQSQLALLQFQPFLPGLHFLPARP